MSEDRLSAPPWPGSPPAGPQGGAGFSLGSLSWSEGPWRPGANSHRAPHRTSLGLTCAQATDQDPEGQGVTTQPLWTQVSRLRALRDQAHVFSVKGPSRGPSAVSVTLSRMSERASSCRRARRPFRVGVRHGSTASFIPLLRESEDVPVTAGHVGWWGSAHTTGFHHHCAQPRGHLALRADTRGTQS